MKINVSGCVKIQQCQPVILKMENKNGGGKRKGKKKKKKKKPPTHQVKHGSKPTS